MKSLHQKLIIILPLLFFLSCGKSPQQTMKDAVKPKHIHQAFDANKLPNVTQPDWTKNAVIYEVNIRQYSASGKIQDVINDLPRLKDLGVDILWLMPVQPIGKLNRKGTLGSYYSIADYKSINPEFGTLDDFKNLVQAAHHLKMRVILDWVANHTAWDHSWVKEDITRYTTDSLGNRPCVPKTTDWTDVADLNYQNINTRMAMLDAMQFWVKETDIDGFRCDVAGMVPLDFWATTQKELAQIKPLFWLAEWGTPQMHKVFNMTYGWDLLHCANEIASGKRDLSAIQKYIQQRDSLYKNEDIIMYFTTNHDENSWNKTELERYGKNHRLYATLAYTLDGGMPLVYTGQEVENPKVLKFFDKDSINWKNDKNQTQLFYKKLLQVYKTQPALWSGKYRSKTVFVNSESDKVLIYKRIPKNGKAVIVLLNFANEPYRISDTVWKNLNAESPTFLPKELMKEKFHKEGDFYIIPPHQMLLLQY